MIITFCGHSNVNLTENEKQLLKNLIICELKKQPDCKFYLGGYGNFDYTCLFILQSLKKDYNKMEILFITPYLDSNYYKLTNAKHQYDGVIYPPLETTPKRYAISKRNKWMVLNSNLVIAYVSHTWGGAYKTLNYAITNKIEYINIAQKI